VLGLAGVLATKRLVMLNAEAWSASRKLSEALQNARSVTIREYAGEKTIARKTATPEEIARLRTATGVWFCDLTPPPGALCFEPHHTVEIIGADGSQFDFEVCFLCNGFRLSKVPFREDFFYYSRLPSSWDKSLASYFASVGMTPKTWKQYDDIARTTSPADEKTRTTRP